MSKILVTGGAGFIGTHLCRRLVSSGHDVQVLDIADPKSAVEKVTYARGDVRNVADLKRAIEGVDAIYHFAAMVSVPLCQERPIESMETNLMATTNVLESIRQESARRHKSVRLIFAGSSVVYGDLGQQGKPTREDGQLAWPISFYGAQKLSSEHAIRLYHQTYGIPAVVFRFFNVFGPGQDPKSPYSGVISIFSAAAKEARALRLNGGGTLTRDFVSVHDVARANAMALSLPEDKCDGRAMNLGTGRSVTIRELANTMIEVSGTTATTDDAPFRNGDVMHSQADITRAKEVLGWTPEVSLSTGVTELLSK